MWELLADLDGGERVKVRIYSERLRDGSTGFYAMYKWGWWSLLWRYVPDSYSYNLGKTEERVQGWLLGEKKPYLVREFTATAVGYSRW